MWGNEVSATRRRRAVQRAAVVALAAIAVVSVGACGSDSSDDAATGATGSAASGETLEGKRVAVVTCQSSKNPWCAAFNHDVEANLEEAGARVTVLEDPEDPALQAQHFNQALALRPAAIVITSQDPETVVPLFRRAQAQDVPVINYNQKLTGEAAELVTSSIIWDDRSLGAAAAEILVEGMKAAGYDEGNVLVITGTAALPQTKNLVAGIESVMSEHPEYEIVGPEDSNYDPNRAAELASQVFAQRASKAGIQGVLANVDYIAAAAAGAAEQAGLTPGTENGDLVIASAACSEVGLKAIEAGTQVGTGTKTPGQTADEVAKAVAKAVAGESQPKEVSLPPDKVTKANIDRFTEQCTY